MAFTADQLKRLHRLKRRRAYPPARHHYSRYVRVMKVLLPALAAILLGLVVVWPKLTIEDDRFRLGFAKLAPEAVKSLSMVNARYFGLDANNHPFTVTADRATQEPSQPDSVDLDQPKADFTSKDGSSVMVQADRGVFHQKEQLLDLAGKVSLYHEAGYELHTEAARIDLKNSTARGGDPVTGQGPPGDLAGAGFNILNKGQDVFLTGRSTLVLKGAAPSATKQRRAAR